MGKFTINGGFNGKFIYKWRFLAGKIIYKWAMASMAMLNNQTVVAIGQNFEIYLITIGYRQNSKNYHHVTSGFL